MAMLYLYHVIPNDHVISKLTSNLMPRDSLITIYKFFIRPHLDYADVIFDKPNNKTFSNRIESGQ